MHKGALHLLPEQVSIHGRTDDILPDVIKTVSTEDRELLRLEIGLGAGRLHPDVSAGACNHASSGRETVKIELGLDWRRDIRSIGRRGRNVVAGHANEKRRDDVVRRHDAFLDLSPGSRHWRGKVRRGRGSLRKSVRTGRH
jgi:hypothetical protein